MKKTINFCKMHGLGNDFVVLDTISQPINLQKINITQLANRHLGIGCDQVLLILPSQKANFACRIFNADGSEAEQCGNGMRCVARFIHENGLSQQNTLSIETKAGIINTMIHDYENIQVEMGLPQFETNAFVFPIDKNHTLTATVLSMGNPHAIFVVETVKNFPVATIGQQVATHTHFPQGTNVGFMEIINRQQIRLRTFERGVGETLACGSNACAAVTAGIKQNLLEKKVTVELPLGKLSVEWDGKNSATVMTGPAAVVFSGVVNLDG